MLTEADFSFRARFADLDGMSDRPAPQVTRVNARRARKLPVHAEIYTLGRRKAYMEQLEQRRTGAKTFRPAEPR